MLVDTDIMKKASVIAKALQLKTAYKDTDYDDSFNNCICYETLSWCRSILYDVLKALEYDRAISEVARKNGISDVMVRSICYDLTKIVNAQYTPVSNTYGDELTYVIHVISEREGCKKGVVANWAPELAAKIMASITEVENSGILTNLS